MVLGETGVEKKELGSEPGAQWEVCRRGGARKGAEKKLPGKWGESEDYGSTDISTDHLNKNCSLLIWGWENRGIKACLEH